MIMLEYRRTKKNKGQRRWTPRKANVMAYARIISGDLAGESRKYDVARYRDKTYGCNCLAKLYHRARNCKHIKFVIEHERMLRVKAREKRLANDCRVNCKKVGEAGHHQCGICKKHDKPRLECGCLYFKKGVKSLKARSDGGRGILMDETYGGK